MEWDFYQWEQLGKTEISLYGTVLEYGGILLFASGEAENVTSFLGESETELWRHFLGESETENNDVHCDLSL